MLNFQVFDNIAVPKTVRDTSHLRGGGGRKAIYPFDQLDAPGKAAFIPLEQTKGLKAVTSAANAFAKRTGRYVYVRLINEQTAAKDETTAQILQAFDGVPQIGLFYRDPTTVKPRKPRTSKAA
jgi:hypothetical protein